MNRVEYEMVPCPAALTDLSGCVKIGDTPTGPATVATWTSGVGPSSTPVSIPTTSTYTTATTTSTSAITTTTGTPGTSSCTSNEYSQCGGIGWTVSLPYSYDFEEMLTCLNRDVLLAQQGRLVKYLTVTTRNVSLENVKVKRWKEIYTHEIRKERCT